MHEFAVLNCTYIFLILKIFPNLFFFINTPLTGTGVALLV